MEEDKLIERLEKLKNEVGEVDKKSVNESITEATTTFPELDELTARLEYLKQK